MIFLLSIDMILVLLIVPASSARVSISLPKPYELSFSNDPQELCRHPTLKQPKIMTSTSSLCFGDAEETGTENRLDWRVMFTYVMLENRTLLINLKIRRVLIFAPGASFTMAGSKPVSVFSRLRELQIGTHYNGYGKVSDSANASVIFQGKLNTTVFEGQIIYQNLNRSHSIQCLHNNSLRPNFYRDDECLVCTFATYETQRFPGSSVGWRAGGKPLCDNSSTDLGNSTFGAQTHGTMSDENRESWHEDKFGFPQTGFSDYNRNLPDQSIANKGTSPTFLDGDADEANDDQTNFTKSAVAYNSIGSKYPTDSHEKRDATNFNVRDNRGIKRRRAILDMNTLSSSTKKKSKRFRHPRSVMQNIYRSRHGNSENDARVRITRAERTGRAKRSTAWPHPSPAPNQNFTETISCSLHLVADHLFFNEMGEKNPAKTVNLMLSVIIGADAVFRATDFDGDGVRDNIGFMVKNITIIHNSSVAFYSYSRTNGNSFQYLKSFSTADFSDVCLGVAFTAIDFQRGVVGLAWYASSLNGGAGKGGICGQRVYLPNEGSSFSFNTAFVSFINHGSSVSMEKAILTMAHEFGHCFGSSHDDMAGSRCNKDYSQGSYLMQKYRPSQYFPNNYKFSPCSLRAMYPVIALKGRCLTRYVGPTCGNGVVEEGEECDCGLAGRVSLTTLAAPLGMRLLPVLTFPALSVVLWV